MAAVQTFRKWASRGASALLVAAVILSESYWTLRHPVTGGVFFALGVSLAAVAVLGRVWCAIYIEGYKTKSIINMGPYSLCRNPLYFFSLTGAAGIGLTTETLTIPILICIGFIFYYLPVIKNEESHLEKLHPADFKIYKQTTPAYWPRFSHLREPDMYTVNPKKIRKELLSGIWFFLAIAIIHVIKTLHAFGAFPVMFKLY